jgi:hypothetical protein
MTLNLNCTNRFLRYRAILVLMLAASTVAAGTVSWVGGSGDWDAPGNWSSGILPGQDDDVLIDLPGNLTITHSSGTHLVKSIQCQEDFVLSGGSLSVSTAAQFAAAFSLSSGTLAGSGDVTITGVLNWTFGTMSGTGKTIIASTGVLNLSGLSVRNLNRVLQNDGAATWTVGTLAMNGGTFNNNGSFTANSNAELDCYGIGGLNAFNNTGVFTKQGTGLTTFSQNVTALGIEATLYEILQILSVSVFEKTPVAELFQALVLKMKYFNLLTSCFSSSNSRTLVVRVQFNDHTSKLQSYRL